jgi:LacI family transcriptional regulator
MSVSSRPSAGEPVPGRRRASGVTSHDVARLAGVSQPTVSRALRGNSHIPDETRARVLEAARALGYVPNQLGRSLSTQTTHRVAMVADLANPLYPALLGPVHDELARSGYRTVLFAERRDEIEAYEGLLDRSVDGVILTTISLQSSLPYELGRRGIPFVFLNRLSGLVEHDSATADDEGGAAMVGELLLRLGHRRIGALFGPENASTSRDRERGLRRALGDKGIAIPARWTAHTSYTHEGGSAAFMEVMSHDDRPTALFCVSDSVAVGALNAARRLGIAVPGDLTVIGFDDLPEASWPVFDLTTVNNPLADSARAAARLLVERLGGNADPPPRHLVAATRLVLRSTHGKPTAAGRRTQPASSLRGEDGNDSSVSA